ncbi:hypothetical protein LWI29_019180 [Acer saccharum]|uniref:Uncharacterized protein n=1 Tax=Acer saccharum TaxID=4024 RepID=A0AA39W354_ACESA|nr:hypothetical protein LWI29_019180 [Acer saccharum]
MGLGEEDEMKVESDTYEKCEEWDHWWALHLRDLRPPSLGLLNSVSKESSDHHQLLLRECEEWDHWWALHLRDLRPPSLGLLNSGVKESSATINCCRGLDTTPPEAQFTIVDTCQIAPLIFINGCSPSLVAGDRHQKANRGSDTT